MRIWLENLGSIPLACILGPPPRDSSCNNMVGVRKRDFIHLLAVVEPRFDFRGDKIYIHYENSLGHVYVYYLILKKKNTHILVIF